MEVNSGERVPESLEEFLLPRPSRTLPGPRLKRTGEGQRPTQAVTPVFSALLSLDTGTEPSVYRTFYGTCGAVNCGRSPAALSASSFETCTK